MRESVIEGTELKLTATIEGGTLIVRWEKLPTAFLFHEGYAALLQVGRGATAGMVELHSVRVGDDAESIGHVETMLPE